MDLPDVRLQLAAVILAEELNFTRAAERLRITQPALSKQIAELEDRVGFSVFIRVQRRVELTDSGQVFVRGCKDALSILEKSIRLAKSTHDEVDPLITIGHSPYVDPSFVSALLSVHLPLHPNLRLRVESMFAPELTHAVLVAELDLALIAEPSENPLLTQVKIATTPLCVAMPCDHPATQKAIVNLEDFTGVGWIVFSRKSHPAIYDRLIAAARTAGVTPIEIHHYMSPQEVAPLIRENFGVAVLTKGVSQELQNSEISVRPLSDQALQVSYYLVLRADQSSRLVNDFGRALLRKVSSSTRSEGNFQQLVLGLE